MSNDSFGRVVTRTPNPDTITLSRRLSGVGDYLGSYLVCSVGAMWYRPGPALMVFRVRGNRNSRSACCASGLFRQSGFSKLLKGCALGGGTVRSALGAYAGTICSVRLQQHARFLTV